MFNVQSNDPETQTDYLIGVLIRHDNEEKYIPFIAHDPDMEKSMLCDFLDFIKKQKDYVIYHWHNYEKTHLSKMMDKYGIDQKDRDLVLSEDILFDLHKIVTNSFAFPLYRTSIKSIAKWMGFEWTHQTEVSALSSINLYHQYVEDQKSIGNNHG